MQNGDHAVNGLSESLGGLTPAVEAHLPRTLTRLDGLTANTGLSGRPAYVPPHQRRVAQAAKSVEPCFLLLAMEDSACSEDFAWMC